MFSIAIVSLHRNVLEKLKYLEFSISKIQINVRFARENNKGENDSK